MSVTVEWNGDEIEKLARRAVGRATVSIGEQISAGAKGLVHVISGDLRRSIHAAVPNTMGERDATARNVMDNDGAMVEVGSWLPYACVEETGRGHAYVHPAYLAVMSGPATATIEAAFRAEGF